MITYTIALITPTAVPNLPVFVPESTFVPLWGTFAVIMGVYTMLVYKLLRWVE